MLLSAVLNVHVRHSENVSSRPFRWALTFSQSKYLDIKKKCLHNFSLPVSVWHSAAHVSAVKVRVSLGLGVGGKSSVDNFIDSVSCYGVLAEVSCGCLSSCFWLLAPVSAGTFNSLLTTVSHCVKVKPRYNITTQLKGLRRNFKEFLMLQSSGPFYTEVALVLDSVPRCNPAHFFTFFWVDLLW